MSISAVLTTSISGDLSTEFTTRAVSWTWGWRSILMLQFQMQFSLAIAVSIVISCVIVLSEAAYGIGTTDSSSVKIVYEQLTIYVLYAFDVMYMMDLILMTIYKRMRWTEISWKYMPREHIVLILEYISLIPLDGMYYAFAPYAEMKVLYLLRLRYAIRIFRLLLYYHGRSYAIVKRYVVHITLVVVVIIVMTTIASVLAYIVTCKTRNCTYMDTVLFKQISYMFLSKITEMGASYQSYKTLSTEWLFLIGVLLFLCNMYLISNFICDIVLLIEEKFSLLNSFQRLKIRLARSGLYRKAKYPQKYIELVQASYSLFWQKKRGITPKYIVNSRYLPAIKSKEIILDMSWVPLKHSHFFRNQETHFLRYLSLSVRHIYMAPGEVIYQKGQNKSKFVYISSGVIEILSEEDDETPIISLSDGTCLGETSLFIDYQATSTVICKRHCELAILERKDFIKIAKLYPDKIRNLLDNTIRRYRYANCFAILGKIQMADKVKEEEMHIKWLKYILRKLLYGDIRADSRHMINKLESTVFCTKFLDMLVIAQKIKLVTDSVFLKKSFPYIFQPASPVLIGWNRFITIVIFMHAFIYLYTITVAIEVSTMYVLYHAILTILWICDLYIDMSTAVHTSQRFLVSVKDIISYKSQTITFLFNVVAAISPGLLLKLVQPNISSRHILLYECNKLLKAYKIEQFFESIKFSSMRKMVALFYLKFIIYMMLLLAYCGGFLVLVICFDWECTSKFKEYMIGMNLYNPMGLLRHGLLHTIHFFCNFQSEFDTFHHYDELLVLQCVFFLFQIVFTAYRTAAEALRRYDVHNISDYVSRVKILLKAFNNEKLFYGHAYKNIMLQYKYDGINFLYGEELYGVLSPNFLTILRDITYKHEVLKFPIFVEASKLVLEEISTAVSSILFYRNSLVISEGEICTSMYLIQLGNCTIKSHNTDSRILGPGDSFCVFETCMQTTSFNTIETLTTCQFLVLNFCDYQRVVLKHHKLREAVKLTTKEFNHILALMSPPIITQYEPPKEINIKTMMERLGIKKVPIKRKNLPKWGAGCRWILMSYTFQPDGRFVVCWEISRCFFAFITGLLVPSFHVSCSTTSGWYVLLLILDFTAWIDIYFRQHVIYYSKYGLQVSHPYLTSVHYWKHAFPLDLLASIPFDVIYHIFTSGETKIPLLFRMNRLLQLYRIHGIVKYFSLFNINHIKVAESLKYAILGLVAISIITSIHFNIVCDVYPNCTAKCLSSLLSFDSSTNVTTTWKYHTMILIFTSSLFMNNYYEFSTLTVHSEELILMVVGLLGYMYWAYVSSNVVSINLTRNFFLISYQNAMKDLVKFMNTRRLDKRLKNEIIAHFEYLWHKKQGIRFHTLLQCFPVPTKKIIFFQLCGLKMLQSSIFSTASEAVMRTLLLQAKHQFILKNGVIYRVNDVIGTLYFLYKGKVEVIGPDGNNMQYLSEGSMLGALDNVAMSRQTLTMTAYGHVELLVFSSLEFHKTLSKHPSVYQKFLRLTYLHVDFIENMTVKVLKTARKKTTVRKKAITKISENHPWMKVWKKAIIVIAMLNFLLETYHISTYHHSALLILTLYILDALYVLSIFLKFNTAYIDEFGILIKNKSMIAARYRRTGLYYDLLITVPFEAISIFVLSYSFDAFKICWTYLRLNRVGRIGYTIFYTKTMVHKLNTNAFWVRTVYCTLLLFVYLATLTSILCFFDSYNFDLTAMTGVEKFLFYGSYWKVMLQMIVKTTISYDLNRLHANFTYTLVLCMLLSKWMAMTYMAQVISTTQIVNKRRSLFQTFATKLKAYMELEYLSAPLQDTNNEYLTSLWSHHDGEQFPQLLEEAPYYLREGVLNSMFGVHLRNHDAFKKCHVDFIRQVSACFKVVRFFPGDIITYIGDIDHCMYFIHKGSVEVLSEDSLYKEEVDNVLEEGYMFGFEQGIYMRIGHEYTYKVCSKALILVLHREDWIHLLSFYPASKLHLYDKNKEL